MGQFREAEVGAENRSLYLERFLEVAGGLEDIGLSFSEKVTTINCS
jgi:hypothetical protein